MPAEQEFRYEWQLQQAIVKVIDEEYPHLLYCATVGGVHVPAKARVNMVRAGYRKGIPDLMFYTKPQFRNQQFCGLGMEVKLPGRRLLPHQLEWAERLANNGYVHVVVHTVGEARHFLETFYKIELPAGTASVEDEMEIVTESDSEETIDLE